MTTTTTRQNTKTCPDCGAAKRDAYALRTHRNARHPEAVAREIAEASAAPAPEFCAECQALAPLTRTEAGMLCSDCVAFLERITADDQPAPTNADEIASYDEAYHRDAAMGYAPEYNPPAEVYADDNPLAQELATGRCPNEVDPLEDQALAHDDDYGPGWTGIGGVAAAREAVEEVRVAGLTEREALASDPSLRACPVCGESAGMGITWKPLLRGGKLADAGTWECYGCGWGLPEGTNLLAPRNTPEGDWDRSAGAGAKARAAKRGAFVEGETSKAGTPIKMCPECGQRRVPVTAKKCTKCYKAAKLAPAAPPAPAPRQVSRHLVGAPPARTARKAGRRSSK